MWSSSSGRCATTSLRADPRGEPAVDRQQDPLVRPGRGDDFQVPAVFGGGVQAATKKPGDVYAASGDRAQPGAGQVGDRVGGAVLGVGGTVPGDLLPGDGVEETVAVVRDSHDQVMAALGMRCEADAQQSADRGSVRVLEDWPPGRGRGTTGAASSRFRIVCWYAESSNSRSACSTGATFFIHLATAPSSTLRPADPTELMQLNAQAPALAGCERGSTTHSLRVSTDHLPSPPLWLRHVRRLLLRRHGAGDVRGDLT